MTVLVCLAGGWMLSRGNHNLPRRDVNEIVQGEGNKESSFKKSIPYTEARPVFEAFEQQPPVESAWTDWIRQQNNAIHDRIQSGDVDSIVNFWFYGTSFTALPRITDREIRRSAVAGNVEDVQAELIQKRLDDLTAALRAPDQNERLQFAKDVLKRAGLDADAPKDAERIQQFLIMAALRATKETTLSENRGSDAWSTLYRNRGLSTDTSLFVNFSLEQALKAQLSQGQISPKSVRRVAIIGPGLDFTDKAEGFDFYPQQSIQPFAVIDTLQALGLATDDLRLTTLDLSSRVNQHLERARQRASAGDGYVIQLPLDNNRAGLPRPAAVIEYWQRFGEHIGHAVQPLPAPASIGDVRVRAVQVEPAVVTTVTPKDVNVVLERLDPLEADEQFDLIIATNVLLYYDRFEQGLALTNIGKMLRPGAFLLTNYSVTPIEPFDKSPALAMPVIWDHAGGAQRAQNSGDTMYAFRRHP
jgi:hypothetical protein